MSMSTDQTPQPVPKPLSTSRRFLAAAGAAAVATTTVNPLDVIKVGDHMQLWPRQQAVASFVGQKIFSERFREVTTTRQLSNRFPHVLPQTRLQAHAASLPVAASRMAAAQSCHSTAAANAVLQACDHIK